MTVIFNAMVMGGTSIHSAFVKGNVLHDFPCKFIRMYFLETLIRLPLFWV